MLCLSYELCEELTFGFWAQNTYLAVTLHCVTELWFVTICESVPVFVLHISNQMNLHAREYIKQTLVLISISLYGVLCYWMSTITAMHYPQILYFYLFIAMAGC